MKHFTPDEFKHCHLGLLLGRAALLKDRIIDTHMEPHGITAAQFMGGLLYTSPSPRDS